jgi:phosphatidylethanolamine-binding protein (PEBP) family uncharacterized protein
VPSNTAEVAIFITNSDPINGKLFVDWAVLGLNPSTHTIVATALPRSAVVGRNSLRRRGYALCVPAGKKKERFEVTVLALGRPLPAVAGFTGRTVYYEANKWSPVAIGTSSLTSVR